MWYKQLLSSWLLLQWSRAGPYYVHETCAFWRDVEEKSTHLILIVSRQPSLRNDYV